MKTSGIAGNLHTRKIVKQDVLGFNALINFLTLTINPSMVFLQVYDDWSLPFLFHEKQMVFPFLQVSVQVSSINLYILFSKAVEGLLL